MRYSKSIGSLIMIIAAALIHCEKTPKLVDQSQASGIIVTGRVFPHDTTVQVVLDGANGSDTTSVNTVTGIFQFNNVPEGCFYVRANAEGYGANEQRICADYGTNTVGTLYLQRIPSQIYYVNPSSNSVIDSAYVADNGYYFTDSTMKVIINFNCNMDTAATRKALSFSPAMPPVSMGWDLPYTQYLTIWLRRSLLPANGTFTMTLADSAADVYGRPLDFTYVVTYHIDSSIALGYPVNGLISGTNPASGSGNVSPTSELNIYFDSLVDMQSVESAFQITPNTVPSFSWQVGYYSGEILTVRFADILSASSTYVVTLKAGWRTATGHTINNGYSFWFKTSEMAMESFGPLNGATGVPLTQAMNYSFNFPIDSTSFVAAYSLKPPLDSLQFALSRDRSTVTVTHSRFLDSTQYTVAIDSTLKSTSGGIYGRTFEQTFTTIAAAYEDTASLIYYTSPHDSAKEVSISSVPFISFQRGMVTSTVESRIRIAPPVLLGLSWTSSGINLTPLNPLETGTTYTVTLDSGYISLDSIVGRAFVFEFTTEPLKLVGNVPFMAQVDVDVADPIALTFNAPLDTSTLAAAITAVPAIKGLGIDSSVSSSNNAHVTYFLAHSPFLADTTYAITLTPSVKDAFGSPMPKACTFTFSTHK